MKRNEGGVGRLGGGKGRGRINDIKYLVHLLEQTVTLKMLF